MATIEELTAEIEVIGSYLRGWTSLSEMPQIERDLAMQRLRKVYDALRGTQVTSENTETTETNEENLPDVEVEFVFDESEEDEADDSMEEPVVQNDQQETDESRTENVAVVEESEEQPVEESELPYQHHTKIDKHVIDTLYGDLPMPETERHTSPKSQPQAVDIDLFDDFVLKNEAPTVEPIVEKPILADVLNNGSGVLNESFSSAAHQDWATKIASKGTDLRHFIGVNDRFMLLRELFGSNVAAYDHAIDKFNEFSDIDECFIYIQEHFQWNPNSPATALMIELITRKYAK